MIFYEINQNFLNFLDDYLNNPGKPRAIISLVGLPAVGKSFLGEKISTELTRTEFVDSDKLIEEKVKIPIKDFFLKYGEKKFRLVEYNLLKNLIKETRPDHKIILATGGGLCSFPASLELLRNYSLMVWVKREIEDIVKNLDKDNSRPILSGTNKQNILKKLLSEREQYYSLSHLTLELNDYFF